MTLRVFVGNTSPSLTTTVTRMDDQDIARAVDLSSVASVNLMARDEDSGTVVIDNGATILDDGTGGRVQYDWRDVDVAIARTLMCWWRVTYNDASTEDSDEFAVEIAAHAPAIDLLKIRQHVETGLEDGALALLVQAATDEVAARFGNDDEMTTTLYGWGDNQLTHRLSRKASVLTSVKERPAYGNEETVLDTDDYDLIHGGKTLIRRADGTNPRRYWNEVVEVTYTPVEEKTLREQTIINLVKLEVQYNGLAQERVGDYTSNMASGGSGSASTIYLAERERIIMAMGNRRGFRVA